MSTSTKETWEVRVPGRITLSHTVLNRANNPVPERLTLGPNAVGRTFRISPEDRRDNQDRVARPSQDPFTNGMLLRVDESQQKDPQTASPNAVSTEELLDLLDLAEDEFAARLGQLNEIAVRQLLDMAESAGASYARVKALEVYVQDHYRPGGPQKSIFDGPAENA